MGRFKKSRDARPESPGNPAPDELQALKIPSKSGQSSSRLIGVYTTEDLFQHHFRDMLKATYEKTKSILSRCRHGILNWYKSPFILVLLSFFALLVITAGPVGAIKVIYMIVVIHLLIATHLFFFFSLIIPIGLILASIPGYGGRPRRGPPKQDSPPPR